MSTRLVSFGSHSSSIIFLLMDLLSKEGTNRKITNTIDLKVVVCQVKGCTYGLDKSVWTCSKGHKWDS